MKSFAVYNLGCRVNAAETNLFAQTLINKGFRKNTKNPNLIFVNTCSVTAKANVESLGLIRQLHSQHPQTQIVVSGCADIQNIKNLKNITFVPNADKEKKINILKSLYDDKVGDKFSHTHRYLLKIQSGCTANCSYCTVPQKRPYLWSLPINDAVNTVNQTVINGYQEIIITGVNLNQYTPGFSNLLEALLTQTKIPLISFGSIPLLCIDKKFLSLFQKYPSRLSHFLHIPIQSGTNKILKLMSRPYDVKKIKETFNTLKKFSSPLVKGGIEGGLSFGTDIIVAFPGETKSDFKKTLNLCKSIGFQKIHTFRFSPRPHTPAQRLFDESPQIPKSKILNRSRQIRSLISRTTLPSRQTPET
jgi:threonylcarbamoyladenosine tRNA methylthiotransferase MtaB